MISGKEAAICMADGRTGCGTAMTERPERPPGDAEEAERLPRGDERGAASSRRCAGNGPIAQSGQSRRLITGRSQVRILVGPLFP